MGKKSWGDWENIELIKEGGAGQVFKVKNLLTGKIGALKVLKNNNRLERFKNEVEAVKKLSHPGIIPFIDANLESDPYYAVFEYEEGGSLGDLKKDELLSIPLAQRLELCEQICLALKTAHDATIIHRDIKPDNILISIDRKKVRLCDFGLVFVEGSDRQTFTKEQIGSRYYIAPELEDGFADNVSLSSDIYSLGKVLYYVISGEKYSREQHRSEKYDLVKAFNDPYLEVISKILDDSVTANLELRISSASTLKRRIETARKNIVARRPTQGIEATYLCIFCGIGLYEPFCLSEGPEFINSGYKEGGTNDERMIFLECNNCGNCQRFKMKHNGEIWFPKYKNWKF